MARDVRSSPYKLNLAARLVRGRGFDDAILQCEASPKKAAEIVRKALLSARANAVHNHGLDPSRLVVEEAFVGKGKYLKRPWYSARGKSSVRTKYRSHVTVGLAEGKPAGGKAKAPGRLLPTLMDRIRKRRGLAPEA